MTAQRETQREPQDRGSGEPAADRADSAGRVAGGADVPGPDDLPVIDFVAPMPGFAAHRRFVLVRLDEEGLLFALTSLDDDAVRFLVVPPAPFFPTYAPEVPQEDIDLLGLDDPDQILVLLVVTAGESASDATANLLAPILVDQTTRRAVQVVLTGSGLPVRAELMAAA